MSLSPSAYTYEEFFDEACREAAAAAQAEEDNLCAEEDNLCALEVSVEEPALPIDGKRRSSSKDSGMGIELLEDSVRNRLSRNSSSGGRNSDSGKKS